jgi:hypothetical protein
VPCGTSAALSAGDDEMNRPLRKGEIPEDERPLSEQFRLVALAWCDADAAASLREELKTTTLEQWKTELIAKERDMPNSHAERRVKAEPRWEEYIRLMCTDRADANKRNVQLDYPRMRFNEWQSREANQRHEARLSRG